MSGPPCPLSRTSRWPDARASEADHSGGIDDSLDGLLDSIEAHELAALALQMVDDSRESRKVLVAAAVGTVVQALLVDGRFEVLVERGERVEQAAAEVAHVRLASAVPGHRRRLAVRLSRPSQEVFGENAIGITAPNRIVEPCPVNWGLGAGAPFDMVNESGRGRVCVAAEQATDAALGEMSPAVQVLGMSAPSLGVV